MLDSENIVRFISLLFYVGMIITSITGFVGANMTNYNEYRMCLVTTSLIIFLQSLCYFFIELFRMYDGYEIVIKNVFYIRAALILQLSILAIGISPVGLGFGIFGIIIFLMNILVGVFIDNLTQHVLHSQSAFMHNEVREI
jgi:hypothetical protein